jgi:hypothetical protein
MDEAALKEWILVELGGDFLKIELYDETLGQAIENARRWFAAKKGIQKSVVLPVTPGQSPVELPDEIDTVQDIAFSASAISLSLSFINPYSWLDGAPIPYDAIAVPQSGGLYSSIVQTLQYVTEAKRILGAELDWAQQGRLLYVWPIPLNAQSVMITGKSNNIVIEQLSERDHDLVKRRALAHAKRLVGRVRTKYESGFPTAQGHEQLDGATLLQEGADEILALDDEISLSAYPMMIMKG